MPFSMDGVDQRKADLFLRNGGSLGSDVFTLSGLTAVNPQTLVGNSVNIIFIGQSTNNNAINATLTPFTLTNTNNVYMGNLANPTPATAVFRAKEPLLCSDLVAGHHGMNLGDALVTDAAIANVVLWQISFGGSYMGQWVRDGGQSGVGAQSDLLSWRIGLVARAIYAAGLDVNRTIIDFQHGEWDTDAATVAADVTANITDIANNFKYWGLLRTGNVMFVHLNTRISGLTASRNAVRLGETNAAPGGLIRLGADIDTLAASPNRYDGTHFNTTGAAAQAALKKTFCETFISSG